MPGGGHQYRTGAAYLRLCGAARQTLLPAAGIKNRASEGLSPPSSIPNARRLRQIFDLEKKSRARPGAGFQRASLTGAVGSETLSRKVSLHVSPAAPKKEGKWALAEKIAGGALFGQTEKPPLLPFGTSGGFVVYAL